MSEQAREAGAADAASARLLVSARPLLSAEPGAAAERKPASAESAGNRRAWRRAARRRWRQTHRYGRFSVARRVLLVNLLAVAFLGSGMLYLNRYESGLIDTELQALATQGGIFAAALGEGAVLQDVGEQTVLVSSLAQGMMRRLVEPTRIRARLFLPNGNVIADSRYLSSRGAIQTEELPLHDPRDPPILSQLVAWFSGLMRSNDDYPRYVEHARQRASDYDEAMLALQGHVADRVRADGSDGLILSVAVPVRHYRQVLGAVMLSVGSASLEQKVNSVRTDILGLFLASLIVSVAMSLYLGRTIARPLRQLAQAALEVRRGNVRKVAIPDFHRRSDEIGELSVALTAMTDGLWRRMDAIERFAADVAHEIKNPLTSLRSAVETAARLQDPAQQSRLMAIIHDDVRRLDRLISDISDASRLDAEMSRLERAPVDLVGMLTTLVDIHETTRGEDLPVLVYQGERDLPMVPGKEGRLVQVFRNLIGNAVSFSPPGGAIRIDAQAEAEDVLVTVEDEGPGIPEGKRDAIFDRFYTERPPGEKFGTHSGLGLSISRQIVEAHGGRIWAENRRDGAGRTLGARFTVCLPRFR